LDHAQDELEGPVHREHARPHARDFGRKLAQAVCQREKVGQEHDEVLVRCLHAHAKLDAVEELLVRVVWAGCCTDGRGIQALYARVVAAHENRAWAAEVPEEAAHGGEEARLVDHEGFVPVLLLGVCGQVLQLSLQPRADLGHRPLLGDVVHCPRVEVRRLLRDWWGGQRALRVKRGQVKEVGSSTMLECST
jgi:hypothetical protein